MNINKKLLAVLIIASSIVSAGIISYFVITANITIQKSFESEVQELMKEYRIPSLAAGIAINDSLVWSGGFGQ